MADIRQLIIDRANDLGMSPRTLAAIISYETAGTFDPMKRGPTTQYGQHEGLIQFGEPQRREYGVDMSSPEAALVSQLGPGGAVVKYFQRNGWQPGMSDLDAYSIVNAGAPGRYNASDANNGGAPGAVRDKVEKQFGGHYANADRLLGGQSDYAPPPGTSSYAPPGGIEHGGYGRAPYGQGNALAAATQPQRPQFQFNALNLDPGAFQNSYAPPNVPLQYRNALG